VIDISTQFKEEEGNQGIYCFKIMKLLKNKKILLKFVRNKKSKEEEKRKITILHFLT